MPSGIPLISTVQSQPSLLAPSEGQDVNTPHTPQTTLHPNEASSSLYSPRPSFHSTPNTPLSPLLPLPTPSRSTSLSQQTKDHHNYSNPENISIDNQVPISMDPSSLGALPVQHTTWWQRFIDAEDVWTDSPSFHQHIEHLETGLSKYIAWLEMIERCRQLDIVYTQSVRQLASHTNAILYGSSPVEAPEQCKVAKEVHWSQDEELIEAILSPLKLHATSITEAISRFQSALTDAREKHEQHAGCYCAVQKARTPSTKPIPCDTTSSLYTAKRVLCELSMDYITILNALVKKTRALIASILHCLEDEKRASLGYLKAVLISLDEADEEDLLVPSLGVDLTTCNISSRPVSPADSSCSNQVSIEDEDEFGDHMTFYIQEKLAMYKETLKQPPANAAHNTNATTSRARPSSPSSLISIPFLNKPRVVQRYSSLDSIIVKPPPSTITMSCGTAKGHLFLKRRSCGNSAPVWARLYFFIQKDTGLLMQQPLKEDAFSVINLKYTTVRPAENEKRDYVIQLTSISKDIELLLQPETLMEYTSWFGALSSWSAGNLTAPLEYNSAKPALKARCSATPSPRGSSNNGRLFLTKRPSFSAASIMMENTLFKSSESFNSIGNSSISGSNSINTIYTQAKSFQDPPSSYDTGNVPRVIRSTPIFMREPCSSKNSGSSSNNNPKTGGWCELQAVLISDGVLQIKSKDILGEETFSQRHHHSIHLGFIQRHQIYILSETVYTRSNCFAIFISPLEMIHISVSTPQERDQWIVLLKFFCVPDIVCSTRPSTDTLGSASASAIAMSSYTHPAEAFSHRYGRTLSISIQEGKNIHMNSKGLECSELYCDLLVDNEKRGVTGKLKKTPTPFWRENFVFTDVPIIRQGITVNIMSRNSKNERETRIGSIFIPSDQIGICNTNEVWYDIRKQSRHRTFASLASLGYAQSYASAGELKVGTRLDEQIVLPFCQYNELVEFLKEFHNDSVYEIARKNSDLEGVTTTLVRIYEGLGLSVPWIKSLIDYEVSTMSSDDANILFRGNSLLTKVIDVYMKMVGKSYLEEAIGSIILSICSSRVCIEVDISKIDKKEDITQNCEKLARYVQLLWTSIEATKLKCPEELRQIFSHLQSVIIKKFQLDTNPDSPKQAARYTCVSGFLFLRLICPAIVSPKLFGIVKDYPDLKTSRTLTLLAKCLMNLANLVDPSSKEPWMKHLNQFSQNNTRGFMDFINFISKAQPASNRPSLPPSWDNILHDLPDQLQLEKPVYMTLQDMSMPPYYVNLPLELSQFSTSLINGSHHYATIQHGKSLKQLLQICQGIASVQQEIHISSKTASSFQSRSSVGDNVSGPECVVNWGIPSSPSSASMNDINTYNAAARSPCHSIDYYRATE